jgi:hypothetical protein
MFLVLKQPFPLAPTLNGTPMKRLALSLLALLSACYLHSWPVTSAAVQESTYKITDGEYQGTAWKVAPGYIMTAGHMCVSNADVFTILASNGRMVKADPVEYEKSEGPEADLCVLKLRQDLPGRPLVLADHLPEPGAQSGYVGYPKGVWASQTGKVVYYPKSDIYPIGAVGSTAACDHGASGSAFFTKEGVFAVLTEGHTPGQDEAGDWIFDGTCIGTPVSEIKSLLKDVGVGWASPPEMPEESDVSP